MSALGLSLRRMASMRLPLVRSMASVTRLPVTMWSAQGVNNGVHRPAALMVTPLQDQVRCYSGADPLNMQFIHDRYGVIPNNVTLLTTPPQSNAGPESL